VIDVGASALTKVLHTDIHALQEFYDVNPIDFDRALSSIMEFQMTDMKSGRKLAHVIEKAIKDSVITMAEYEEITSVAYEDGALDKRERALLRELNALIANKTVTFGKSS
jgi:ATP-dependent protease Clp ATPase subunit